jgi:hypothetical protein
MRIYFAALVVLTAAAIASSTLSLVSLSHSTRVTHTASYQNEIFAK